MNRRFFKRTAATLLAAALAASLLPASVWASVRVPMEPGSGEIPVEYFTSTLFNWNETLANEEARARDWTGTGEYEISKIYDLLTGVENGTQFVIANSGGHVMTTGAYNSNTRSLLQNAITENGGRYKTGEDLADYTFTVSGAAIEDENTVSCNLLCSAGYLKIGDENAQLQFVEDVDDARIYIESAGEGTFFIRNEEEICLNNFGGENNRVGAWRMERNGRNGRWLLLSFRTEEQTEIMERRYQEFFFTVEAANQGWKSEAPSYSKWNDHYQNWRIYSGLAAENLTTAENAPFSNAVVAADLFDTSGNAYTDVYTDVKVPFYIDDDGYYNLNSDTHAVYFADSTPVSGAAMKIADLPNAFSNSSKVFADGYQPFTSPAATVSSDAYNSKDETGNAYSLSGDPTYGFGMVTDIPFQMNETGVDASDNPIEFTFSGDDDVWVYIDNMLALDIGGTHDAITGSINFQTGDVSLTSEHYCTQGCAKAGRKSNERTIGDNNPDYTGGDVAVLSQGNIYEKMNTSLADFAAVGQHTLRIYYMDRGQGRTNALIRFNLPQEDLLTVTKDITKSKDKDGRISPLTAEEQAAYDNVPFGFTLWGAGRYADSEEIDVYPIENKKFVIYKNGISTGVIGATDNNGHFYLKNGESAHFFTSISESGTAFYVIEDALDAKAYTAPSFLVNGEDGSYTGNAFQSNPVFMNGSNVRQDIYSIVCSNYRSEEIPNPYVFAFDDRIVLDYGIPVDLSAADLLINDTTRGESILFNGLAAEPFESGEGTGPDPLARVEGTYGDAVYDADAGKITYTLNKEFNGIDELYYSVSSFNGQGDVYTACGKLLIIPASSVYYEDDFPMLTYQTAKNAWGTTGTPDGFVQEAGFVGTGTNSTYGSDRAYLNNLGDSYGTCREVDVTGGGAKITYSFTGTGTAIYSRISPDSAYIRVKITAEGADGRTEVVDTQYIDTRVIGSVASSETLYNIPVYLNNSLDLDRYNAEIYVYKKGTKVMGIKGEDGSLVPGSDQSGNVFCFDGFRVFTPVDQDETQVDSAYSADGEKNMVVVNIASKIAADDEAGLGTGDFVTLTDINDRIVDKEEYAVIGPNNELYLSGSDYRISFKLLNWDGNSYGLYLGMKSPGGSAAQVRLGSRTLTLNNSVDCYYRISQDVATGIEYIDGEPVKVGTVTLTGVFGLVSLSNIKVVGTDVFNIAYSEDISGDAEGEDGEDGGETDDEEPSRLLAANTIYLVTPAYLSTIIDPPSKEESGSQNTAEDKGEKTDGTPAGNDNKDIGNAGKENVAVSMYRLYNPNSGEHFYTADPAEKKAVVNAGWIDEGIGWLAVKKSGTPVYRLYNPNAGDHHYTISRKEKEILVKAGWKDEGIGWYSCEEKEVPLYRQYNPNAVSGAHNFTVNKAEKDSLVKLGWKDEGIAWYGCADR